MAMLSPLLKILVPLTSWTAWAKATKLSMCKTRSSGTISANVTDLIVFGDSYTDSCNAYNGGYFAPDKKPPSEATKFPVCPPGNRADGGHSWLEWIRIDQGQVETNTSAPGGDPVRPGQWRIMNFAFGGATCDNSLFARAPIPDVGDQIMLYQTKFNSTTASPKIQTDPDTTIACIFIGTNDIGLFTGLNNSVALETDCIGRRLATLHDLGFRRILLIQNINLEDAPQFKTPETRANVKSTVNGNNAAQAELAKALMAKWQDGSVIDIFPAYDLYKAFYDNPKAYGFTNVTAGCNGCSNLDGYLWKDDLHPSNRSFIIFSRKLVRFVDEGIRGAALINGTEGV